VPPQWDLENETWVSEQQKAKAFDSLTVTETVDSLFDFGLTVTETVDNLGDVVLTVTETVDSLGDVGLTVSRIKQYIRYKSSVGKKVL
jgi:hypothetical protein